MFSLAHICFFLGFLALHCTDAAHIVGVPSIGLSHGRVLGKIGRELAKRGHKFTLLVPSDLENDLESSSTQGFQVRSFESNFTKAALETQMLEQSVGKMDVKKNLELWIGTCEDMLNSDVYSSSLNDIDFMLCDIGVLCCPILADKLRVQRVDISPTGFGDPFLSFIHNFPNPAAYIPQMSYWLPNKLSFFGRVQNTLIYSFGYLLYIFYLIPSYEEVWQIHVTESKFQSLDELFKSTGLLLITTDFILTKPRPVAAHVKVIGAIMPEPAKTQIAPSFQELISSSHHSDVVLVSFGTVISNFSSNFIEILSDALGKLPALVIWKHKGFMPSNVRENVKIFSWIPQNDLLSHPRTKLFITHGGLNSIQEAIFHGVPMVVVPIFGDQFDNAANVQHAGFGEKIDLKSLTKEELVDVATKVLNQKSYFKTVKMSSDRIMYPGKFFKLGGKKFVQPLTRTPTEQAADWVEYGLYNNAALHLRGEADNLCFGQLYLIDVLVFLLVMLYLVLKVLYLVVKFFVNNLNQLRKVKSKTE